MKKLILMLLALSMLLPLTACAEESVETNILIVYFSATNTTEGIAEILAEALGADLFEIIPEVAYTDADLNWRDSNSRTTIEMNDPDARPAMIGSVENMEGYDTVFVGYPIWWAEAPRIICTFLEAHDLTGKTVIPFCTSGSSGIGSSAVNLHELAEEANWLDGRRFAGGTDRETLIAWLNELGFEAE